ncbi:hypothetical protein NCLIV_038680 [Neospora caninum Liverpool]|uniref:Uncharacterized protein n=1 Tax=Neospora caninum (strain Liverpool) TaxID=572307 RepID=F0VAN8_NEOCL|nr:hypothetical protein NCLIV_038680 [Neospora caninum Liverpool]CBZ50793.1 hypothetical protein NCLIV_038680 [Neospora caninum Liverpool]CEL68094.1 TPA: hypothetical protein BN1204_038680 [Neospora caninum Liverpool]|eukprot:XP_003880826.1 hypothetical protein NCLIV_038680 [Neospora caninum Liverpool]
MSERTGTDGAKPKGTTGKPGGGPSKLNAQVQQLFARMQQEIEDEKPANVIFFIVDFLCKHYPEHLQGFATIWNADPDLEKERLGVVEFFRAQKLPTEIAAHFTNAGFDTLETLCTLTSESLDDIEKFNQVRWLPGHKVRLQQTFADIAGRVRTFTEDKENLARAMRASMYCHHSQLMSKPNLLPSHPVTVIQGASPSASPPCYFPPPTSTPVALPTATAHRSIPYSPVYQ